MSRQLAPRVLQAWQRLRASQRSILIQENVRGVDIGSQLQFLATGVLAALEEQEQLAVWSTHEAWQTALLPLEAHLEQDELGVRFLMVLATELLPLVKEAAPEHEQKQQDEQDKVETMEHWLLQAIALPVLALEASSGVQATALAMVAVLTKQSAWEVQCGVLTGIKTLLLEPKQVVEHDDDEEEVDRRNRRRQEAETQGNEGVLCRALQIVVKSMPSLDREVQDTLEALCCDAIASFETRPALLRAVCAQILPMLVDASLSASSDVQALLARLSEALLKTWELAVLQTEQNNGNKQSAAAMSNLLFVLCVVLPRHIQLLSDSRVQQMLATALAHDDSLQRKQALHLLHIALELCAATQSCNGADDSIQDATSIDDWQRFLSASEVIQLHHEPHLIEQVWPQVELLVQKRLMQVEHGVNATVASKHQWAMPLTFSWLQGLLHRVIHHANPVVRRDFLSKFMQTCVTQATPWLDNSSRGRLASASFILDPAFQSFVEADLLSACNAPLLYKSSRRVPFQALMTEFLTTILRVQLIAHPHPCLNRFVVSICSAVFGSNASSHSPEAFLSMLQVFECPKLQQVVTALHDEIDYLDDSTLEAIRIVLDVYVLRAFPFSVRTLTMTALQHLLTGGFVDWTRISTPLLAMVLNLFPSSHLSATDLNALDMLHHWLSPDSSYVKCVAEATCAYLTGSSNLVSASQLARMLIFTATSVDSNDFKHHLVLGSTSLQDIVAASPKSLDNQWKQNDWMDRLLVLAGKLELELMQINAIVQTSEGHIETVQAYEFRPNTFYGQLQASETNLQNHNLLDAAFQRTQAWLAKASTRVESENSNDAEGEDEFAIVEASAIIATRLATYAIDLQGDLDVAHRVEAVGQQVLSTVFADRSGSQFIHDKALALRWLAIVSSEATIVDAVDIFHAATMLPQVLSLEMPSSFGASSPHTTKCRCIFASSQWALVHHVVAASVYISSELVQKMLAQCVDALPRAGDDTTSVIDMLHVIAVALSQSSAMPLSADSAMDDVENSLDTMLTEIWQAFVHCKAKSAELIECLVQCVFQPSWLQQASLTERHDSLMKRWFRTLLDFGRVHRPQVVMLLCSRLVQIWRTCPSAARWFADDIAELLLYKEPILATDKAFTPNVPEHQSLAYKTHCVRLLLLTFLDEITVDSSETQALVDRILHRVATLVTENAAQRAFMPNSDGYGRTLRGWQALCVLSRHVTSTNVDKLSKILWNAFAKPQLQHVRFYMEIWGMHIAMRFPDCTINGHVRPLLRNCNLTPQVSASLLLVLGWVVHQRLEQQQDPVDNAEIEVWLEELVPWLNASQGHTRVVVQFLLGVLVPRFVHQQHAKPALATSDSSPSSLCVLFEAVLRFLSENKECKRMFRRQQFQLARFRPSYHCTLAGLLSSSELNEFNELCPREASSSVAASSTLNAPPIDGYALTLQLKDTMQVLYDQFQREHFADVLAARASSTAPTLTTTASTVLNVQRKIDTDAISRDNGSAVSIATSSLLAGLQQNDDRAVRQRHPIIVCATLVDKTPNLAGLARTCEIFNAQELVVPSLHVREDEAFQTISVTADKWVPMTQVRQSDLVTALQQWQHQGYVIVAVEQTASSTCLSEFRCPDKMVLVLGKEKEGIPVDVLQVVDQCVEIPQFGLIRSLNVHVSGALMLWEYTQQRMLRAKATFT